MSSGKALGILLAVIVVVAAYLGLTHWLGINEPWAGFLFLLQWSMMEHMKAEQFPKSVLGATLGTAIPFMPLWFSPMLGEGAALAVMLGVILIAIFLLIKGAMNWIANSATMLFLTVVSIPQIAKGAAATDIFLGLFAGVIFFGGLAGIAAAVKGRSKPVAADTPTYAS